NDFIANMIKSKNNIPARDNLIRPLVRYDVFQQLYQRGLSATHRTRKQDALIDIHTHLGTTGLVLNKVKTELVKYFPVLPINFEVLANKQFSLGIKVNQDFFKIIIDFISFECAQRIRNGSLSDDMWRTVFQSG